MQANDPKATGLPLIIPSLESNEEWLDVILHFSDANITKLASGTHPPISERFELCDWIWIERLDPSVARAIATACGPANFNMPALQLQDHTYAFVRKSRLPGSFTDRGGMEELASVVVMSRLVHPTTMGFRYTARVALVDGRVARIFAHQLRGVSVDTSCSRATTRDWLNIADGVELKSLIPLIVTHKLLPKRVHNAYWHHEYAMRTFYVDHRWVLICTGLEALEKTNDNQSTWQFTSKVRRLAALVDIDFTVDELKRVYTMRSGLVHGQRFLSEQDSQLNLDEADLYDRMEETLRRILLRCFLDEEFAAHFKDESTISAFLPFA